MREDFSSVMINQMLKAGEKMPIEVAMVLLLPTQSPAPCPAQTQGRGPPLLVRWLQRRVWGRGIGVVAGQRCLGFWEDFSSVMINQMLKAGENMPIEMAMVSSEGVGCRV